MSTTTTSTSPMADSLGPTNSSTVYRRNFLDTPQPPNTTARAVLLESTTTTSLRHFLHQPSIITLRQLLLQHLYWELYPRSDINRCDGTTSMMEMVKFTTIIALELQTAEELIHMFLSYTGSAYDFAVYFRGKLSATGSPIEGTYFYTSGIRTIVRVQALHDATAGVLLRPHHWTSAIGNIHSVGE